MAFHGVASVVLAAMLVMALRDWLRMRRYAGLLSRPSGAFVTVPATVTGIGGPFGSMQYRFRFDDEGGRPRRGRFYVTTAQHGKLAVPGNLAKGSSITVTYARSDPACVYLEPYRAYYLSYLRRGSWFLTAFMLLVGAGLIIQVIRITGYFAA